MPVDPIGVVGPFGVEDPIGLETPGGPTYPTIEKAISSLILKTMVKKLMQKAAQILLHF